MAIIGDAFIKIKSDTDGFEAETSSKVGGALKGVLGVATGIMAAAGGAQLFKGMIDGASDLGESISKNNTIFEGSAAQIKAFGDTASKSIGASKGEALEATGVFGNLLRSMGLGAEPAAQMSIEMVKLAADMASFNNTSIDEALEAIRGGLIGSNEPLQKYGVNINQAMLSQKAFDMGLIASVTDALDPQTKALAAQALMLEQTSLAQGDFARTSDGLANQSKILKAELSNLSAEVGTALLPVITGLATFLVTNVIPAMRDFGGFIKDEVVPVLKDIGTAIVSTVGPPLMEFARILRDDVAPVVQAVFGWFVDNKEVLLGAVVGVVAALIAMGVAAFTATPPVAALAVAEASMLLPLLAIGAAVAVVAAGLIYAYTHFEAFRNVVDAVGNALQAAFSWLQSDGIPAIEKFGEVVTQVFGYIVTYVQVQIAIWRTIIETALKFIEALWRTFGDEITAVIEAVFGYVANTIQAAMDVIKGIIKVVMGIIHGDFGEAWDGIKQIFSGALDYIKGLVDLAMDLISAVISAAMTVLAGIFDAAWDGIKAGADAAWDGIKALISAAIDAVVDLITDLPSKIAALGGLMLDAGQALIEALWDGLKAVAAKMVELVGLVITGIGNLASAAPGAALSAGTAIIEALWNGLKAVVTKMAEFVSTVVTGITGLPGAAAGAATAAGTAIIEALWNGLQAVVAKMAEFANTVIQGLSSLPGQAAGVASQAGFYIVESIGQGFMHIMEKAQELVNNVINMLAGLPGQVAGVASQAGFYIIEYIGQGLARITEKMATVASEIITGLANLPGRVFGQAAEIGYAIVNGIIQGLGDVGGAIWNSIQGGIQNLRNMIQSALSNIPIVGGLVGGAEGGNFIPHYGQGGTHRIPGGMAVVGERGPELVHFGGNAAIFPHDQFEASLQRALGNGGGGGGGLTVNVSFVNAPANPSAAGMEIGMGIERALTRRGLEVGSRVARR